MPTKTAVLSPNLGLFLGSPSIAIPKRGLMDGKNFRVKLGRLSNLNTGYSRFGTFTLDSKPVALIDNFVLRSGTEFLIFGNTDDLFQYDAGAETVLYITPAYVTGTVAVSAADPAVVTGVGTLFNTSTNVKAGDQISFGSATETGQTGPWYTVDTVDSDTQLTLTTTVAAAPIGAGSAYTNRQLFTGDMRDLWSTEVFPNASPGSADLWFATNGVDTIVTWNGTDTFASQSAVGITAKKLKVFNNMMIYGNVIQSGTTLLTTVINSDVGIPEDIAGGLASQFIAYDGVNEILDMQILGDNLVLYSERDGVLAQFVGDPLVFTFRTAFTGVGPIGPRTIADFGDFHQFIGPDAQYQFDGVRIEEKSNHVWREYLRTRDPSRAQLAFHHFDEENGDLVWSIPLAADASSNVNTSPAENALAEHYLEKSILSRSQEHTPYSKRDFPFTATGFFERSTSLKWDDLTDAWEDVTFRWDDQFFAAGFPLNMAGDASGKIYTLNTSQNADTAAIITFVRFPRFALGDGTARGLLTRIYPFAVGNVSASHSLDIILGLAEFEGQAATDTSAFTFALDLSGNHFVSTFRRARFVEVEFRTDGVGEPWELEGYDIELKPGGRR